MEFVYRSGEAADGEVPDALILTLVSIVDRSTEIQSGHRRHIGADHHRPVVGERLHSLLPTRPKARGVELAAFKAADRIRLIRDAVSKSPKKTGPVLTPGRRNNRLLNLGSRSAIVEGRLVELIHKTHGDQDQSYAKIQRIRMEVVEVQEFHKHIAATRVFEFDLRVEHPAVGKLVPHVKDGAKRVENVIVGAVVAEADFPIAPDRKAGVLGVNLGGRRPDSPDGIKF